MTKIQFINYAKEVASMGSELNLTDSRFLLLDLSDSLCKDGEITSNQYSNWCFSKREIKSIHNASKG